MFFFLILSIRIMIRLEKEDGGNESHLGSDSFHDKRRGS